MDEIFSFDSNKLIAQLGVFKLYIQFYKSDRISNFRRAVKLLPTAEDFPQTSLEEGYVIGSGKNHRGKLISK